MGRRFNYLLKRNLGFGLAAIFLPLSTYLLYRRRNPRVKKVQSREELAASRGWTYAENDPSVLQGWKIGPLAESEKPSATRVVRGEHRGLALEIFDFQRRSDIDSEGKLQQFRGDVESTVWVVRLPENLSPMAILYTPSTVFDRSDWLQIPDAPATFCFHRVLATDPAGAQRMLRPSATQFIVKHVFGHLYFDAPGFAYLQPVCPDGSKVPAIRLNTLVDLARSCARPPRRLPRTTQPAGEHSPV